MFSQLAKQSHWKLSADISIADEHYELLMKAMAAKLGNNCQALFSRIRIRLSFCNEQQAGIINYLLILSLFFSADFCSLILGRPLHCDTCKTTVVNKEFIYYLQARELTALQVV